MTAHERTQTGFRAWALILAEPPKLKFGEKKKNLGITGLQEYGKIGTIRDRWKKNGDKYDEHNIA